MTVVSNQNRLYIELKRRTDIGLSGGALAEQGGVRGVREQARGGGEHHTHFLMSPTFLLCTRTARIRIVLKVSEECSVRLWLVSGQGDGGAA
jgi:hypothetical protein